MSMVISNPVLRIPNVRHTSPQGLRMTSGSNAESTVALLRLPYVGWLRRILTAHEDEWAAYSLAVAPKLLS